MAFAKTPVQLVDDYQMANVFDLLSLKKRVIVITGGAQGIGLALGFAAAEAGASIAIVDAAAEPDVAFKDLRASTKQTEFYRSDVTDFQRLKLTFDSIARDFGRIDGFLTDGAQNKITAAGVVSDEPMLQRDPASVKRCLEINSLGTYYAIRLATEQMVRQPLRRPGAGAGSIVTIASVSVHQASRGQYTSDYCMSKGAVLSLTKQLGVELAEYRIRVNCLSPGYISTSLTTSLVNKHPRLGEIFNTEPPMKRIGKRSDLKGATVFLLSDASSYMTSGEILITGGMHAGRL
ncbi:NADP-dependent mannitol dehydrogenase [Colletotrichum gloeosporioides]|uniref:NADP-dependent mannitol dehydrogenase n=1 Tax=Colletotrichum gloeosporioides TaxID=474922 RepID=A0A8H4C5V1_COLGL|nr:NADP-dependent mannitol dehydrogenase [Colletotrichum gloeosporioides]KAF3797968.1 NADP-dependent mannitol dehydrogenase [Colletotrichum gloeosporioides]